MARCCVFEAFIEVDDVIVCITCWSASAFDFGTGEATKTYNQPGVGKMSLFLGDKSRTAVFNFSVCGSCQGERS